MRRCSLFFLVLLSFPLGAQDWESEYMVITAIENPAEIQAYNDMAEEIAMSEIKVGMKLDVGYIIETRQSSVELEMQRPGAKILLGPDSVFQVQALSPAVATEQRNAFYLYKGILRCKNPIPNNPTRLTGVVIVSDTAVFGLQVGDFLIDSLGSLTVFQGTLLLTTVHEPNYNITQGQGPQWLTEAVEISQITEETMAELQAGYRFQE
jgi:hypothetical protein